MLELRPTCEQCNKALPAEAADAMICSYECTFCADCVDRVLQGVCPNCGGNFVPRPIRPATEWRPGVSRTHQKPGEKPVYKPVAPAAHQAYAAPIKKIRPEDR